MENVLRYTNSAVENFFKSTMETACEQSSQEKIEDIYTTMIALYHDKKEFRFFLCMREDMLKALAMQLLFEEEPDQDTLIDLLNESANLIIGNAKMLWEEDEVGITLTLGTPEYQGFFEKSFSKEFEEKLFYHACDESIMIGLESLPVMAII